MHRARVGVKVRAMQGVEPHRATQGQHRGQGQSQGQGRSQSEEHLMQESEPPSHRGQGSTHKDTQGVGATGSVRVGGSEPGLVNESESKP